MKIRRAEDGFGPLGWDQDALPRPLREGQGRTGVALEVLAQGRDLVVRVTGGAAHVGAVAVCAGRSMADHAGPAGQVLVVPGHREGTLAAETAEAVARATGCTCAAVVGIHQDDATPAEIHAIVANVRAAVARLTEALRGGREEKR